MSYANGNYKMRILIVSHDAGGAEIVSAWVKANPQNYYYFILQGPAIHVFSRKIALFDNYFVEDLAQILLKIEFVLTGTSWGSDLERIVIKEAYEKNIFVASYLDHWVNYLERFLYHDKLCLPNEIWVGDDDAENLAKNVFEKTPIRFVQNYYFLEIKKEFETISSAMKSEKLDLLYICEPVEGASLWKTGDKNNRNYTEFSALEYFFKQVHVLNVLEKLNTIKIRLHPSESVEKYDAVIAFARKQYNCKIIISKKSSLLEDFFWADWVVGISSMALVIAVMLNKTVFICAPKNAIVTKLPLKKINQFDETSISILEVKR